ncbi:TonB-dependent receptor domain-containing protein [Allosphingosinicella sp.]|uniref:TonB-dependent receptor domain-containing protein n=1 Tax=Allosphingosinicella sp. TaxID=2823234 RepID=UPI002EEDEF3B
MRLFTSTRGLAVSGSALALALSLASPAYAQAPEPVLPGGDPCQAPSGAADSDECVDSQDQPQGEAATTASGSEESIVVVGSRIRRNQFNTADPIQLITRDEATQAGFNSTAEILQSTAVTGGTAQISDIYGGFVVAGGPGVNTISLRGLGTTRTLVLMNGRRVAPAGSRGSVGSADLNVLPNAIIDRIEILNTGASSIYGSDAIAGVINIVTRNNINGLTIEATHQIPQIGAGNSQRYSVVGGFSSGRFNVSGSLEYFKRDTVRIGDVDWARCPRGRYGTNGENFGEADFINPRTNEVQCFPLENNGVTVNTIGAAGTFSGFFRNAVTPVALAPGVVALQPAGFPEILCNRFRPAPGAGGAVPGFECVGGLYFNPTTGASTAISTNIRDTFAGEMFNEDLISPVEIYTGYGQFTFDTGILGGAELYADLLVNRRNSRQTGHRQFTMDYMQGSPLIPVGLRFPTRFLAPGGQVPYSTGIRVFGNYGTYDNYQTVDFVRLGGGLRGDFFLDGWRYDLFAGKTWSDSDYTTDLILADRLASSMDVVQNANGTFSCRINIAGCVAAPALTPTIIAGGQNLRGAWFDFVTAPVTGHTAYREATVNFTVDGPLFRLPAGEIAVAVGIEYRDASIDDTPSEESQRNNLYGFTSSTITRGSDSVVEVFGEVEIPVIRDSFIHDFTINASGRYTEYESYGGQETYKVGAILSPVRWLSLRGSYGTSYRAPALYEQFLGATSGFIGGGGDPCNNLSTASSPLVLERCQSEGIPIGFVQNSSITVIGLGGAEAGLEAETSKNLTFGGVLQPRLGPAFGDLSIAVDYFNVKVDNGVSQLSAAQVLSQCYASAERATCDIGLITRTPYTGPGSANLTVIQSFVNISDAKVEGIDFTLRYARDLGPGRIRLGAAMTKFIERYNRLLPTDVPLNVVGLISNPEWTGTFDIAYTTGPWNLRWGVDWVGATDAQDYALSVSPAFTRERYDFQTRDYFLHSASVRYETDRFGLTLGVRNVFDTEPPTITADYTSMIGNAPLYSGYDHRGRTFFVNARAGF